ncbi:MAG: two pore domain potassium channel family protein [Gammaproteobacteria bacterium]|nr:two pore domain potassium channel family protein [Gammaproteobacteria bacterium]
MISVFLLNISVVAISVLVHYEFLYRISAYIPKMKIRHRFRIVVGVFGALIAHAFEIWIFAIAYYLMNHAEKWGHLSGEFNGSLMDCAYFSFTVYTTLGFGDIQPNGHLRYLTGIESLTGLVLITWTASFLYFEMQRYWDVGKKH